MELAAVVTGASSGIGYELSKILASEGYKLVLVARNVERLKQLGAELRASYNVEVALVVVDLSKQDAAVRVADAVAQTGWTVDILVNCAGFGDAASYASSNWEKQYNMVQVNVVALIQLTKLLLPGMLERKSGLILNIASLAAFSPGPYMSVYYASKAFVLSFSEALSEELKGSGITVTAECPGPTNTGFEAAAGEQAAALFSLKKNAAAKDVAHHAYRSLKKGKVVAIPGFSNKAIVFAQRLLPRSAVRSFIGKLKG